MPANNGMFQVNKTNNRKNRIAVNVKNKDTKAMSIKVVLVSWLLPLNISHFALVFLLLNIKRNC